LMQPSASSSRSISGFGSAPPIEEHRGP
jgi:hypothetical protein